MKLAVLDSAGQLTPLDTPYSSFGSISVAGSGGGLALATTGGSPTRASEAALLLAADVDGLIRSKPGDWRVLRKSAAVEVALLIHARSNHPLNCPPQDSAASRSLACASHMAAGLRRCRLWQHPPMQRACVRMRMLTRAASPGGLQRSTYADGVLRLCMRRWMRATSRSPEPWSFPRRAASPPS